MSLRSSGRRSLPAFFAVCALSALAPVAQAADSVVPVARSIASSVPAAPLGPPAAVDVSDQIIVRHRASLTAGERAELRASADVRLDETLTLTGTEVVQTDGTPGAREAALTALRRDPGVLWAEPNAVVHATTADPGFPAQWALTNTGAGGGAAGADVAAPDAWTVTKGAGVTVGVVDTGVQSTHEDLVGQVVAGTNFASDGGTSTDDLNGHGTHVSGIIAAAENTVGVVGVAPQATVQPFRALSANGSGTTSTVANAFNAAGDAGDRIVNASLGSTQSSNTLKLAITSHPNTLFVVAAGNNGANVEQTPEYPCSYTAANVLCVGASDDADQPASFSNSGATSVDLFAPGVQIFSTYTGSTYEYLSGTSMATPMVSGVAALVLAANPTFTTAQLKAAIMNSVDHPAALAALSVTGGRLDAATALGVARGAASSGSITTPVPTPASTPLLGGGSVPTPTSVPGATAQPTPTPTATPGSAPTATPMAPSAADPAADGSAAAGASEPSSSPAPTVMATPKPVGATETATSGSNAVAPVSDPAAPNLPGTPAVAELSGLRVATTRGTAWSLAFRLSAPASVTVTVRRSLAHGARTKSRSRHLELSAGRQLLPIAGAAHGGLGLGRGAWRVTLHVAGGGTKTRVITVR